MYSFPNLEPVHCSMSSSVVSWPAYRFLRRQVRWSGIPISGRISHSLLWPTQSLSHSQWSRSRCFLEFSYFFCDPADVGNLISRSSAFSKSSLYIWTFSIHILLKPSLKDFEHYLAGMYNECNCAEVWTFFGIDLLWDWNENWPFPTCRHCWVFQICWHIEWSTLTASSFVI